jgi:hypothetical protein
VNKIIALSAALLITSSAYCWKPYTSPATDSYLYELAGYQLLECPNCHEERLFPNLDFVVERYNSLTPQEIVQMVNAVTNYVGDLMPGRLCPFCGLNTPK